ncbi:MAG: nitroreductase [Rhizobiales bacterium]|nr:nitroreductase [Hyphomicrobiales bacterium]
MSQTKSPLLEGIMARRSGNARALGLPGPDDAQITAIVKAGAQAPDHGRLVPFRFLQVAQGARSRLADLLEASSRELWADIPQPEIERAREKADQGPEILALIGRIDPNHPKITASDQWLAVGAALENMLLAVQACGFAAAVRSGKFLETKAMRDGFALGPNEHLTCLIAIGTPSDWPPQKPKPELDRVFSVWNG